MIVHVADYGAAGDGATDDWDAFVSAEADAAASGCSKIVIGPGAYRLVVPTGAPGWAITQSMVIEGVAGATELVFEHESTPAEPLICGLYIATGASVRLSGLSLVGPTDVPGVAGVHHSGGAATELRMVDVRACSGWDWGGKADDVRDAQSVPSVEAADVFAERCEFVGNRAGFKHNEGTGSGGVGPRSVWTATDFRGLGPSQTFGLYAHRGLRLEMDRCRVLQAAVDGLHHQGPSSSLVGYTRVRDCEFSGAPNAILVNPVGSSSYSRCTIDGAVNVLGSPTFESCTWVGGLRGYDVFDSDPGAAPCFVDCDYSSGAVLPIGRNQANATGQWMMRRSRFRGPSASVFVTSASGPMRLEDCSFETTPTDYLVNVHAGSWEVVRGVSRTFRRLHFDTNNGACSLDIDGFAAPVANIEYVLDATPPVRVRGRIECRIGTRVVSSVY